MPASSGCPPNRLICFLNNVSIASRIRSYVHGRPAPSLSKSPSRNRNVNSPTAAAKGLDHQLPLHTTTGTPWVMMADNAWASCATIRYAAACDGNGVGHNGQVRTFWSDHACDLPPV